MPKIAPRFLAPVPVIFSRGPADTGFVACEIGKGFFDHWGLGCVISREFVVEVISSRMKGGRGDIKGVSRMKGGISLYEGRQR